MKTKKLKRIIYQLRDLRLDRESFLSKDEYLNGGYLNDIWAINQALKIFEKKLKRKMR